MLYKNKLRGSFGRIYPVSLLIVYILCCVEAYIRWRLLESGMDIRIIPGFSMGAMGIFFAVMGIIQLFKYRLVIYPFIGLLAGLGCFLAIFVFGTEWGTLKVIYVVNILVILLLIVVSWPVLSAQERFEANARRLFKLAAEQVIDTTDGYTDRPFSAGKVDVEEEDMHGFIRFLDGKFIARPARKEGMYFLSFSLNKSVLKIDDPAEVSYVAIDPEGKIKVQISKSDYRQYRAKFSFDQLCASMGGIFIRFLGYYREGKEHRIVSELKTAR